MSNPDGKYKTEIDKTVDEFQAVADRFRDRLESDEAATVGHVKIRALVIGCLLSPLFGFIAGHIQ
jgi:hypothetical protein